MFPGFFLIFMVWTCFCAFGEVGTSSRLCRLLWKETPVSPPEILGGPAGGVCGPVVSRDCWSPQVGRSSAVVNR